MVQEAKSKEQVLAEMDEAAEEARADLVELMASDPEAVEKVKALVVKHYPKCGYKRIAKLIAHAGEE